MELNTEHYKSDFKYDIAMFKKAAQNPDGETNRFLWLSRSSGTYCFPERDAYIKDTEAFNYWNGCATILGKDTPFDKVIVNERVLTFAVNITGIENGRIKGDLYELNYPEHVRQLNRVALPRHTVTAKHEDGTTITLPYKEYDGKREQFYYQHGKITDYKTNPQNPDALRTVLKVEREQREKNARPAMFKVRVQTPKKPSIKQKIAVRNNQLAQQRAAAPVKTATKNTNVDIDV